MKKFLALAEYGSFMKILFTNDNTSKDLISEVSNAISQCPYETFETPTGTCKVYKENSTWIAVTDNIVVDMLENETDIEVHLDFEDQISGDFKDTVYLTICYILGYIIYRDRSIYCNLLTPYMSKLIMNGDYGSSVDFDEYNTFTKLEESIFNIKDHIPVQDIIFNTNLRSYVETDEIINTTVIDVTNLDNVFKVKDMFFID